MASFAERLRAPFKVKYELNSCELEDEKTFQLEAEEQFGNSQRPNRPVWSRRAEFLLAATGYAVGFGNIWRFPWLLMKNGGGAFLLPYLIMLAVEGIPLFFMEMSIGQRHHSTPIPLWMKISNFSTGVGFLQFGLCVIGEGFYLTLLAWALYYFAVSFQSPLPWSSCDRADSKNLLIRGTNQTLCKKVGPTVYYWYEEALQISDGINKDYTINWKMALCQLAIGLILIFCLIKGIRSAGKVVYFTTIFPYVVLSIFLIRGLMLKGSGDGIKFLFSVDPSRLVDPYVWLQASAQIFFSLSLASGGMVTYASYNPTHQDVFIDTLTISIINAVTSIVAGLAVFSLLGHRAYLLTEKCNVRRTELMSKVSFLVNNTLNSANFTVGRNLTSYDDLETELRHNISRNFDIPTCTIKGILEDSPSGSGLAFITLTEVINQLPAATFFSIIFFLMLITVGLDSSFGGLEAAIGSLLDLKKFHKIREEIVTVVLISAVILISLTFTTKSGEYFLQLMNTFGIDITLITFAFMEMVTIVYFYGLDRFCADVKMMTGRSLGRFFRILLGVVSPLLLFVLLITTIVNFVKSGGGSYQLWDRHKGELRSAPYPAVGIAAGWTIIILFFILLAGIPIIIYFNRKRKREVKESEENENTRSDALLTPQ